MTLIDTEAIMASLVPGTLKYRLVHWFVDHVNFCSDYADGSEKPANPVYDFCRTYWLFPFKQTGCACCNTVRGLIYGAVIGFVLGAILC